LTSGIGVLPGWSLACLNTASSNSWSLHSQARCCPRTKQAASASLTGSCWPEEKWPLRLQARFMHPPMLARRVSGLGTPAAWGRMDGERKPWPTWE